MIHGQSSKPFSGLQRVSAQCHSPGVFQPRPGASCHPASRPIRSTRRSGRGSAIPIRNVLFGHHSQDNTATVMGQLEDGSLARGFSDLSPMRQVFAHGDQALVTTARGEQSQGVTHAKDR